ncbi:MAG: hypothetical protein NT154_47655, partial [Verrucomicrobia bacterium]|nr:hypothetical protein [Verrucomicrobiota bacterium]
MADQVFRNGVGSFPGRRVSKTVDLPFASRRIPSQVARGIHHAGDIHHLLEAYMLLNGDRQHRDPAPQSTAPDGRQREGKFLSAVGFSDAPYHLFHSALKVYPRTAGGGIAGCADQADFHAQPLCFGKGMPHRIPIRFSPIGLLRPGI